MNIRILITLFVVAARYAFADDLAYPVSVTVLPNSVGETNGVTFALTNLTAKRYHYHFITLEPRGIGGAWLDARTQDGFFGAGRSHSIPAGAITNLVVRPPRGADVWRLQFWFTPVDRSSKQVTMRTEKIVEK